MNTEEAYNIWAQQYDSNENKTRDLEAVALRETLDAVAFNDCLEIGCGTGKNTQWLVTRSYVTAIDLSEKMLAVAKEKINSDKAIFIQADISNNWNFTESSYDLVTFSLVLEHIENLEYIFRKVTSVIRPGAYVYIGELHPFKQYTGTKARFDTASGRQEVVCYTHHLSEFTGTAKKYGFEIEVVKEYFDNDDKTQIPRILSILLQKK